MTEPQIQLPPRAAGRTPLGELFVLAAPIIALMVSRMAMQFIDFAMVSVLGTAAQAAVSPSAVVVFAVLCIGMGMASGVQTYASQADGRGEPREAAAYTWQMIHITLLMWIVFWPLLRYVPAFFEWSGGISEGDPEVIRYEIEYATMALWSFVPAVVCSSLESFFNGVQKPRLPLIAMLLSIVLNVTGNYALIYGHWGFPEMGIRGAALATVLAWWVRALFLMAAFCMNPFSEIYSTLRTWLPSPKRMAGLVRVGGPMSLIWLLDIGAWFVFLVLIVPGYGTETLAATNIAIQYMHVSFMPAIGIGLALRSLVGFAIGEGKPDQATDRARLAERVTMAYMGSIGILFYFVPGALMGLLTDNPDVIAAGVSILLWVAIFQVADAMMITYSNALQGAGDTRWPAGAIVLCCWVIFIGGGWLVRRFIPALGFNGPWMMAAIYITILGLLLRWRWNRGTWRRIRLFEEKVAETAEAAPALPAPADARVDERALRVKPGTTPEGGAPCG